VKQRVRSIKIVKNYLKHAEGSCLFSMGKTTVLCVASVEEKRPPHAEEKGIGWVSAEYAMLPRATGQRTSRKRAGSGGRVQEISRLVGRSLRAVMDLEKLGPRSITIDCDVIQADGGTRTASVNGGMIAMALALKKLYKEGVLLEWPLKAIVGAVSVGVIEGKVLLDLDYEKDKDADTDCNFVITDKGQFVEIQGTAEKTPFSEKEFIQLVTLAKSGIKEIIKLQKTAIGKIP
jgi:ribonuclease PH